MNNKLFGLLAPLLAACLLLTACGDDNDARLRVVHASPDASNVDVFLDESRILSDVPFKGSSDYRDVRDGSRRIQVRPAGASSPDVIDATVNLTGDTDFTLLAVGLANSINPLLLTDDNSEPTSGNAKIRIVHAAPSAPAVDVYLTAPGADIITATPQLTNVPFQAFSGYLNVPAGSYQARVTIAGTKTVAIDSGQLTLESRQIRTVVAVDNTGGGAPFGLIVLRDSR
ncbi:MAG TPA: DUF4397 domain-containing protein [Terriglobales bacterium]|nr:DUF4397 domain-containing protein [Terriglobales bacterium]